MLKALLFFLILGNNSDNGYSQNPELDEMPGESKQTECLSDSSSFIPDVDTASIGYKLFNAAKKYLGVPYAWGGRSKKKLDCMGLIFLAYSNVTGKDWKKLSVYPSRLVKSGKLGHPVEGLDGIIADNIQNLTNRMRVGDIVYLLTPFKIIEDDSLAAIDSTGYWPWHMGIYAGHSNILHANPFANEETPAEVTIEPLEKLLQRTNTSAIFVTRLRN